MVSVISAFRLPKTCFAALSSPSTTRLGFVIDDELAYPPLAALGWRVEAISWRTPSCDWRAYDAVVIRSTWDYIADPDAFLAVLAEIERAGTPLFNALDLVRWNIRKTYLRDLAQRGVPVVPTIWRERLAPESCRP